jgi:G3E family GTPase
MPTEIYIVSGFLGAGKTTLIRKLLDEVFQNDKVAIVENDFGEANVDAALLGASGIQVTEINSGCICCNLSGDFIGALQEVLERFDPDKIVIEPSGVAKLSDVIRGCLDRKIAPRAELRGKITVVDASRCQKYRDNFGEFFEDQIQYADVVLLSRIEDFPDKTKTARELVEEINSNAKIWSKPWTRIAAEEILPSPHRGAMGETIVFSQDEHDHWHDGEHSAEDFFDTTTLRVERIFSEEDLKACVSNMEKLASGTIFRAKGIVRGKEGYWDLQYLPGELKIGPSPAAGDVICFIGRDIDRLALTRIFGEFCEFCETT